MNSNIYGYLMNEASFFGFYLYPIHSVLISNTPDIKLV